MKTKTTKKLFAFIITVMIFSAISNFATAQRTCPPGEVLLCDQYGKHCKCVSSPQPPPCRGCYLLGSQSSSISFSPDKPVMISAKIFDASGRLLKTIAGSWMSPGQHEIEWNKRDEKGKTVTPGIYIVKFNAGSYSGKKTMLITE